MASIPSCDDLGQLPLRGLVCYIARIVRRLEPELYRIQDQSTHQDVEQLLKQAEAFSRGDNFDRSRVARITFGQQPVSSLAYLAASTAFGLARDDARSILTGTTEIFGMLTCMSSELQQDFEQLRSIYTNQQPPGDPIDPSEAGPLGPLWLDGSLRVEVPRFDVHLDKLALLSAGGVYVIRQTAEEVQPRV